MVKVYIAPNYTGVPKEADNGGIRRVVEAQIEHLHKFDVEVVNNVEKADVICNHGSTLVECGQIPLVHVGHGLYWSRQPWGDGYLDVNRQVVESMRHSVAHTVPSEWVNRAVRRGGFWYPEVVYHGVDADQFKPGETVKNYILWNKARADYVSDPGDMLKLAERMRTFEFVSTIGSANRAYKHPRNLRVTGVISHEKMETLVSEAGVYLATARETFGIGTLEALACGVPVAGWDWGGQSEIVINGVTGYLAPPGDFDALAECVDMCLKHRAILSENAVADVRARWGWEKRIEQYADIFHRVHKEYNSPRPKVSVIVTAYNLDKYMPKCLDSVKAQTFKDFECLVVDDANSRSTEMIVSDYAKRDKRIRYLGTVENMGLPGARNFGLQNSRGHYVRHVDADDYLADNALELEVKALDEDRSIDIVYGHLEVVREDGTQFIESGEVKRGSWPGKFNWYHQMLHLNQLPSCSMARREVYTRSGGYRVRMKRQEDAEFWCRVTSLGFRAKKFTEAVTYYHRERHDSKGALEWKDEGGERDWTAWFPWRMGATSYNEAVKIVRQRGETPKNPHMVPFGAQGKPPKEIGFWYVHDFAYPVVSIIVTCGPGHKKYLIDALDSIQAQTYPDWECVVVNDTGEKWGSDIMGAPWAKVVNMDGNRGASEARNEGLKHVRGKQVIWMDADDYWFPWFLERMVGYSEYNTGVIYSDLLMESNEGMKIQRYSDFDSREVTKTMQYPGSSILVPKEIAETMVKFQGGFDTQIPGMEDWDYQIAVHHLGFCAFRIREPLFVYRLNTSTKRERDYAKIDAIVEYINNKWSDYRTGKKAIMCGCKSPNNPPSSIPASLLSSSGNFTPESIKEAIDTNDKSAMVMVEYVGPIRETFSIKSRVDPRISPYRFGNNELHKSRAVFLGDAQYLLSQTDKDGNPTYRVISNIQSTTANDPASFLGQPIVA